MSEIDVFACAIKRGIEAVDPFVLLANWGFKGGQRVIQSFPFDVSWQGSFEPQNRFRSDDFTLASNESHILLFALFNILYEDAFVGSTVSFLSDPSAAANINLTLRRTVFKIKHNSQDILESVNTNGNNYKEHSLIDLLVSPSYSLSTIGDAAGVITAASLTFTSNGFVLIEVQ